MIMSSAESLPSHHGAEVDLDPFLTMLESRLRAPFSSLDLVRALSSAPADALLAGSAAKSSGGGGEATTPRQRAENVRLVGRVFDRMAKPVKLRAVVGLMGLDPGEGLDRAVWDVLAAVAAAPSGEEGGGGAAGAAMEDEWVRTLAGLVRGIMFKPAGAAGEEGAAGATDACRGKETAELLRGTADDIVSKIRAAAKVDGARGGAGAGAGADAAADPIPNFVPDALSLLPPALVRRHVPSADANPHFGVRESAPILQVDAENERRRADEEIREMEARERVRKMAAERAAKAGAAGGAASVARPGGRGAGAAEKLGGGRGRGHGFGQGRGRGRGRGLAMEDATSLFVRTKRPAASSAPLGRRGTAAAALGRVRGRGDGRGAAEAGRGRGGPAGRGATGGSRVMGRGAAAAAVGGKSLGVPTVRKPVPGSARALLTKRPAGVTAAAAAAGGAKSPAAARGRAGRALGGAASSSAKSKMMMIDTSEVQGLSKERAAREEQQSRAIGSGKSRKRKIMDAAANDELAKKSKGDSAVTPAAESGEGGPRKDSAAGSQQDVPACDAQGPKSAPKPPPGQSHQDWRQHLVKSNKLSAEERSRVEQFFTNRFNPTPETKTYRMKLNEERTTDSETGQTVKETLYLELDYTTFGFRKTRKIKGRSKK